MPGRLTVCPTPIGNLDDLTPRVRDALAAADLVACGTQAGGAAVQAAGSSRRGWSPTTSRTRTRGVADRAADRARARVALVTDAGTPAMDPGYRLIRTIDRDLELEVLPASAVTTALSLRPAAPPVAVRGLPPASRRGAGAGAALGRDRRRVRVAATIARIAVGARVARAGSAGRCSELTKLHEEVARRGLGELARRFRRRSAARSSSSSAATGPARPRRHDGRRRPAPPRPVGRAAAGGSGRRRGPHRHAAERALPRADGPRPAGDGRPPAGSLANLPLDRVGVVARDQLQRAGGRRDRVSGLLDAGRVAGRLTISVDPRIPATPRDSIQWRVCSATRPASLPRSPAPRARSPPGSPRG